MKNILVYLFAIIPLLMACNKDNDYTGQPGNTSDEITLKAEVKSSITIQQLSGPINSGFSTDFPAGIYAYNPAWVAGSTANVINNDSATVKGTGDHSIVFEPNNHYYYPADGTTVNFFAFAPHAKEVTAAGTGTSPVLAFKITGQEDIMWASSTGYKNGSSAAVPPVLAFQHKLTQLQFTFKADSTYTDSGNKVVSLTISAQPDSVNMTVGTGVCTFHGSALIQALSGTNQTNGINITSSGTSANSPIMTNAASGSSAYLLTIVVKPASGASNVTYSNVPLNITTSIGSAHMITLTFKRTAVTATATVADWLTGAGGSVSVL